MSEACAASITKKSRYAAASDRIDGRRVCVIDTPGLFDTEMTEEQTTREIVKCIAMSSPGPHAIILVTKIGRFTEEERRTVQHFVNHFGTEMYKYMIVAFTGMDDLEYEEKTLEEYIMQGPPAMKAVLELAGNRYVGFNNRASKADLEKQVKKLFDTVDAMVSANGGQCYTDETYSAAEEAMKRREEELKRQAEEEKAKEREKILKEAKGDNEKRLKKLEEEHKRNMDNLREQLRREAEDDDSRIYDLDLAEGLMLAFSACAREDREGMVRVLREAATALQS